MLESIISPRTAERNPWDMVVLGFAVSSLAIWIAFLLAPYIPAEQSMLSLAITVIVLAPLLHRILVVEEEKDESEMNTSPLGFVTRHIDVISVYAFLFVGLLASFSFWYMMLPADSNTIPSSSDTFSLQESAIVGVQQQISGKAMSTAAEEAICEAEEAAARAETFNRLTANNIKVMIFCFLASFLFGAGGVWLLTWNASVWGVHIGVLAKATFGHMGSFGAYCAGFPMYSLSLALWAIPEGLAYIVAAIAGGIVSVAVSRHHFKSERFWFTLMDAGFLLLISFSLVIVGAYIEHFFVKV